MMVTKNAPNLFLAHLSSEDRTHFQKVQELILDPVMSSREDFVEVLLTSVLLLGAKAGLEIGSCRAIELANATLEP